MKLDVVAYGPEPDRVRMVLGDVHVYADNWLSELGEDMMTDINLSILSDQLELVLHRKPKVGGERNEDGTT